MGSVEATLRTGLTRSRAADRKAPKVGATEFREVLEQTLSEIDADERAGPSLRAADLRIRFRFPDVGLVLNVAPSEERSHHLRWTFSNASDWEPKLELVMSSQVANAYLQGKESLAIAIAHGQVRYKGDTRCALRYLPAMRVVVDAYRRLVREHHPELVI